MAAQDFIIFEPTSSQETEALDAFGKALKLKFKIAESDGINSNEEIEIPEWHKVIVADRLAEYRKNPQKNLNFDVMLEKIRKKYNL